MSVALAQIGEFSFILATLGRELGLFTQEATNMLVAASILSIVVNPLLYRTIDPDRRVGGGAAAPARAGSIGPRLIDSEVPPRNARGALTRIARC